MRRAFLTLNETSSPIRPRGAYLEGFVADESDPDIRYAHERLYGLLKWRDVVYILTQECIDLPAEHDGPIDLGISSSPIRAPSRMSSSFSCVATGPGACAQLSDARHQVMFMVRLTLSRMSIAGW